MTLSLDVHIVRGAFEIHAELEGGDGETVALLGPNGSGKSTIVACLAGLLPPHAGTVVLDGRTLDDAAIHAHLPSDERPVGVVFQDGLLFPHLSGIDNVAFPLRARGVSASESRTRARELLDQLGFPAARAGARPRDLSGGEAQRVAIARALIHQPRLLLMDEPTSSLDVQARSELRPVIRATLAGFEGVRVLVTHDPVEALTLADRIVVLEEGRVTQSGTPEQLRNAPRTQYVAELVGLNLFAGRLEPLDQGAGSIITSTGSVVAPWPDGLPREPVEGVLGVLRPSVVVLHIFEPQGSARNVVHGRVAEIAIEGERARVRLASTPPVVAEITLGSLERLDLREGGTAWASFKAVEVTLVLP